MIFIGSAKIDITFFVLLRMIFNFIWENEESRIAKTALYNQRSLTEEKNQLVIQH